MARDEVQQQVVLGMFAARGGEFHDEGGQQLVPEAIWKLGLGTEELLKGERARTAFGQRLLGSHRPQRTTVEQRLEAWVEFAEVVPGPGVTHGSSQRFRQTSGI